MLLRVASLLFLAVACGWPQPPAIPDTPAGHTLQAWLDAFNSGDRARIQAYHAKYEPTKPVDGTVAFRDQTGGFELIGIDKSERLHIEFRVKEKASPTTAIGKIDVKDTDPAEVTNFTLRAIPPGMTAADMNQKNRGRHTGARDRRSGGAAERVLRVPGNGEEDGRRPANAAEEGRLR